MATASIDASHGSLRFKGDDEPAGVTGADATGPRSTGDTGAATGGVTVPADLAGVSDTEAANRVFVAPDPPDDAPEVSMIVPGAGIVG